MSKHSNNQSRLNWRKATKSNPNGSCVELAAKHDGEIALRNSRDPNGPVLSFTKAELDAFLDGAKKQEFDDLAVPLTE